MLMVLDLWKGAGDRWKGNHRERQVEVLYSTCIRPERKIVVFIRHYLKSLTVRLMSLLS